MITAEDFCYKLQGFAEIGGTLPTNAQWNRIMELADEVTPPSDYDSATVLMRPDQFANWLKGFIEIADRPNAILPKQWTIIQDHLALVFTKVTPDRNVEECKNKFLGVDLEEILEKINKEKNEPWKKGVQYPSILPQTICKAETSLIDDIDTKAYCASSESAGDLKFCINAQELADLATPQNASTRLCGGGELHDEYPPHDNDVLGDNPGGYK